MDTPSDAVVRRGRTFEQVQEWLIATCEERLACGRPSPDEPLSVGGMDSLHLVELLMFVEEEFDISVPIKEETRLTTVRQISEFVWRALKLPGPESSGEVDEPQLSGPNRARWLTRIYHVELGTVDSEADYWRAVEEILLPALRVRIARDLGVPPKRIVLTLGQSET